MRCILIVMLCILIVMLCILVSFKSPYFYVCSVLGIVSQCVVLCIVCV